MNQRLLSGVASAAAAFGPGASEALAQPQAPSPVRSHVVTYEPQIEADSGIGINEPLGLEVLEAAVGATVLARIGRGLRIRRDYKFFDNNAQSTVTGIHSIQELSIRQAADLADDEPQVDKLYGIKDEVGEQAARLEKARATFRDHYHQARRRIWPGKDWVKEPGSTINIATANAQDVANDGRKRQQRLAAKAEDVHASVHTFRAEVNDVNGRAQDLRDSGWDLGRLEAQIEGTKDLAEQARQLEGTGHITQTKQFVNRHMKEATVVYETVDSLPDRREQADASIATFDQRLEFSRELVSEARTQLASLAETYDASCYADLQERDETLDAALGKLERYSLRVQNHKGKLSFSDLRTSEGLIEKFGRVQTEIAEAVEKVQKRVIRLAEIEANLPTAITELEDSLAETHGHAFEEYAGDIEDDTRQGVVELQKKVAKLKARASADKPTYLELDETSKAYQEASGQIHQQAKQQRQEMEDLRQGARRGAEHVREMSRSIGTMLSSESDYRGGAWTEIDWEAVRRLRDSIKWPEVNTELSRVELREQRGSIAADEINADSVYHQIQSHVRRARETKHIKERTRRELGPLW